MKTETRALLLEDETLIRNLAADDTLRREAIEQLPPELSWPELSHLVLLVSNVPGVEAIREGRKLEREVLLEIGKTAVVEHGDLVTAESAARGLFTRLDLFAYLRLNHRLRKARKVSNTGVEIAQSFS